MWHKIPKGIYQVQSIKFLFFYILWIFILLTEQFMALRNLALYLQKARTFWDNRKQYKNHIVSEIFSELNFFLALRHKTMCRDHFLWNLANWHILFCLQRTKRLRLLRPMLVSELTEKPLGRRREAKERRVTSVGLASDTLIRLSAAWHVTMGFPAEIFSWK